MLSPESRRTKFHGRIRYHRWRQFEGVSGCHKRGFVDVADELTRSFNALGSGVVEFAHVRAVSGPGENAEGGGDGQSHCEHG